jgi:hypothetical protein
MSDDPAENPGAAAARLGLGQLAAPDRPLDSCEGCLTLRARQDVFLASQYQKAPATEELDGQIRMNRE